ncbi:Uncharacterised protein [Chromobacterium violaceum]|uniref:Uncharacterized protein n=2 Tax=Chromobacterium violaceum TaxID=536 RepID=A0AAX2M6N0_CHRVL|nr:hypothetical protein BS642_12055 [Chromobacterium violaceum]STB64037.1 Uncharacterised protein [Chromobacterium violaceum]SUX32193.1 Uncharacterised protein [Chromobacterium violaceum]
MARTMIWMLAAVMAAALATVRAQAADPALAQARADYWRHPYRPDAINRLAVLLAARGEAGTASLLLSRALLISPGRADIRANLERVRRGERRIASSAPAAAMPAESEDVLEPRLPAPWPQAEAPPSR